MNETSEQNFSRYRQATLANVIIDNHSDDYSEMASTVPIYQTPSPANSFYGNLVNSHNVSARVTVYIGALSFFAGEIALQNFVHSQITTFNHFHSTNNPRHELYMEIPSKQHNINGPLGVMLRLEYTKIIYKMQPAPRANQSNQQPRSRGVSFNDSEDNSQPLYGKIVFHALTSVQRDASQQNREDNETVREIEVYNEENMRAIKDFVSRVIATDYQQLRYHNVLANARFMGRLIS